MRRSALISTIAVALALSPAAGRAAQPATPFDADLLRLSEILGALSWLDSLCKSPQAPLWRERMDALIRAQRMSPDDRRRYVDVFNRGQRTFASVHRACTDQTRRVLGSYLDEGATLAARLEERFGRGGDATGLPAR